MSILLNLFRPGTNTVTVRNTENGSPAPAIINSQLLGLVFLLPNFPNSGIWCTQLFCPGDNLWAHRPDVCITIPIYIILTEANPDNTIAKWTRQLWRHRCLFWSLAQRVCFILSSSLIRAYIVRYLVDIFGQKKVLLGSLIVLAAFITMTFAASNIVILLVGEILCGIPWGVFATTAPAYASEVLPLALRVYMTSYTNMCKFSCNSVQNSF